MQKDNAFQAYRSRDVDLSLRFDEQSLRDSEMPQKLKNRVKLKNDQRRNKSVTRVRSGWTPSVRIIK